MQTKIRVLPAIKNIALVAHDNCKDDLMAWCTTNKAELSKHQLYGTGTTSHLLKKEIPLDIIPLLSGPMGGDQQLGAMVAKQKIDVIIFFWDPMNSVPHDPDVKALLRISTVWNIPVAMNSATANCLIHSSDFSEPMPIEIPDYDAYLSDRLDGNLDFS